MEKEKAIEIFNRQINCYKTDSEECVSLASCSNCKHNVTPEELTEAMQMAISALKFKENYDKFVEHVKAEGKAGREVEVRHSGRVFMVREVAQ